MAEGGGEGGNAEALSTYIRSLGGIWMELPRAKTARLIRTLLDLFDKLATKGEKEKVKSIAMKLCADLVTWSIQDKRAFLKQALEFRLAGLYYFKLSFKQFY